MNQGVCKDATPNGKRNAMVEFATCCDRPRVKGPTLRLNDLHNVSLAWRSKIGAKFLRALLNKSLRSA